MERNDMTSLAPRTNPDVGKPATLQPFAAPRPPAKTHVAGSALVPTASSGSGRGAQREYFYWVGVTPSCPRESVDCAGINFPKVNENLIPDPMRTERKQRVPVIGAIVKLTEDRIRLLRERLPRLVVRFLSDPGQREEPGTGKNIGDNFERPRKGHLITIPSDKDVEAAEKAGRAINRYVQGPNDAPAARFMFAVLCTDQTQGDRGNVYPECLEVTGLEWPDAIDELEALL